jgi:two-component sensor histidine kinase
LAKPAVSSVALQPFSLTRRQVSILFALAALLFTPLIVWPPLAKGLLAADFLPHAYCYLRNPALVWTNVVADSSIGVAYLAISVTIAYLIYKGRRGIPFHWVFVSFGLFIVACAATHFLEVLTVWIPAYVFSSTVKVITALVSVTTAASLPFAVPQVLALVQQAKISERVTAELRASEERKDALLREIHHRVKNNLAVICSLFYLQSAQITDEATLGIFHDMERRVHSMALVHAHLYDTQNLECSIDLAGYAKDLVRDVLLSYGDPYQRVELVTRLESTMISIDIAVVCGLILNELVSNALKHGFPNAAAGQIVVTLSQDLEGRGRLCVEDNGVGLSANLDVDTSKSMGLRLIRALTRQVHGSFELLKLNRGTSASLIFEVNQIEN